MNPYTPDYYDAIEDGSRRSAEIIVPIVMDLIGPGSVIDVGCGTGAWLGEFMRRGVGRALGLDGGYVRRDRLRIPVENFTVADLCRALPVDEVFDLAVCLEVAEHLPPDRSEHLVGELTRVAEAVLFSAAIPFQGGEGHTNERWPTFWRDLFESRGYSLVDAIRPRVWSNRSVEPWYQQNAVLFASERALAARPALGAERERTGFGALPVVHPRMYGLILEREGIKPPGPWPTDGTVKSAAARARVRTDQADYPLSRTR